MWLGRLGRRCVFSPALLGGPRLRTKGPRLRTKEIFGW